MDNLIIPLTSHQIAYALSRNCITRDFFQGVYPSDALPEKVMLPCGIVINTDPSHLPGTHWLAIYINENKTAFYFDSFGFKPNIPNILNFLNNFNWKFNTNQIQSLTSPLCGHYATLFLLYMSCDMEFEFTKNLDNNDAIVILEYLKWFGLPEKYSGGKGQKCVCFIESSRMF
jgi:hypothetical protein